MKMASEEPSQASRKRRTVVFRDRFTGKVIGIKVMVEASTEEPDQVKKMKELLY